MTTAEVIALAVLLNMFLGCAVLSSIDNDEKQLLDWYEHVPFNDYLVRWTIQAIVLQAWPLVWIAWDAEVDASVRAPAKVWFWLLFGHLLKRVFGFGSRPHRWALERLAR